MRIEPIHTCRGGQAHPIHAGNAEQTERIGQRCCAMLLYIAKYIAYSLLIIDNSKQLGSPLPQRFLALHWHAYTGQLLADILLNLLVSPHRAMRNPLQEV